MNAGKGLYIHIPFCRSKCPYCSFHSVRYDESIARAYVERLCDEMRKYSGDVDTVYFGGGTPSVLPYELIGKILSTAREQFDIAQNAEITIECNPSKKLDRDFDFYKQIGINRISLGMQSARDEERRALGRLAGKAEVEQAINDARGAGIYNISLDLMLGTPKQTLSTLDESFEFIHDMNIPHISAYMLKLEEGTKFYEMRDKLTLPDDDIVSEMYLKTIRALKTMGIYQYEISNFAKPGFESRHNTKYWTLDEYLGLGTTAHSFIGGKRFYYDKDFKLVFDGCGGDTEEQIMLGLRLSTGIDKTLVKKDYSALVKSGFIVETNKKIALTPQGMLVSNVIINKLI